MSASVMQLSNISSSGVLKPSMVANSNCNDSVPEEVKEEFEMNDCRVAM